MNIKSKMKRVLASVTAGSMALVLVPISASAATTTQTVTPTNNQGWVFNPDPTNATPYQFTTEEASIGVGSLYVEPIGVNPLHKFIAQKTLGTPVSEVSSIAYDFLIAGDGTVADANQFYLNVYTNLEGSSTFYDCRFDYVPSAGSTTDFTTATFNATDTPTTVGDRTAGSDTFVCPTTLTGMPAGSTVKAVVLNVGDTGSSDTGLAGYLDNVVINAGNTTIYDFEPYVVAMNKNQCKKDGYKSVKDADGNSFKNQGRCVSYTNRVNESASAGLATF